MVTSNIWNARTRVLVPAATYPLTVDAIKAQLRISGTQDDDYIETLIPVAVDMVQQYLGRFLYITELSMQMDAEDIEGGPATRGLSTIYLIPRELELQWLPLAAVSEVATYATDDTRTVFDSSNYIVDDQDQDLWGRIVLTQDASWPSNLRPARSIEVLYTVGYGIAETDIPPQILQGLLMVAAYLYQNRGDCPTDCGGVCGGSGAVGFINAYRVRKV